MSNYKNIESALIRGGIFGDPLTRAVNVPIYQTSTFQQPELGTHPKWEYARTGNPTRAALESLIGELEGGTAGFAFASGMAAISTVLQLFKSGDRVLISSNVYGGTFRILDRVFKPFGLEYAIVDTSKAEAIEAAITEDVAAILVESPANPLMTVTDIRLVCGIAKAHGILTVVDNTFMTPYLQRPLELGADIVIHSATKYLGGHSDLVAGLVVVKNASLAERIGFIQNAVGAVLGPMDSFLLIRGIKTLAVRIEGIGNDFIPDTMDMSLVDQVVKITDNEAFRAVRVLARREGVFAGSSSGGALAAAKKLIEDGARGNIVAVFPDRGDRYFSKGLYREV